MKISGTRLFRSRPRPSALAGYSLYTLTLFSIIDRSVCAMNRKALYGITDNEQQPWLRF